MKIALGGARKRRETIHDVTICELSEFESGRIRPDRLRELAAAYRAAGEEQEARILLNLAHIQSMRGTPLVFDP